MTTASLFMLACVLLLFLSDAVTLGRAGRRALVMEALIFLGGGFLIAFPTLASMAAQAVGIGRGADLVLYLVAIWLVRESIHARHARLLEQEQLTEFVRSLAMERAVRRDGTVLAERPAE